MSSLTSSTEICNQSSDALLADTDVCYLFLPAETVFLILQYLNLKDMCNAISASSLFEEGFVKYWRALACEVSPCIDEDYGLRPPSEDLSSRDFILSFCNAAKNHWEYEE